MALGISSGQLGERITVKEPVITQNNEGGEEFDYSTPVTEIETWAMVAKPNIKRTTEALAETLVVSLDFYLRRRANVEPIDKNWLIEYAGEEYTVNEVDKFVMRDYIRLTAKSRTNG